VGTVMVGSAPPLSTALVRRQVLGVVTPSTGGVAQGGSPHSCINSSRLNQNCGFPPGTWSQSPRVGEPSRAIAITWTQAVP
jgi:hypothetical protein